MGPRHIRRPAAAMMDAERASLELTTPRAGDVGGGDGGGDGTRRRFQLARRAPEGGQGWMRVIEELAARASQAAVLSSSSTSFSFSSSSCSLVAQRVASPRAMILSKLQKRGRKKQQGRNTRINNRDRHGTAATISERFPGC